MHKSGNWSPLKNRPIKFLRKFKCKWRFRTVKEKAVKNIFKIFQNPFNSSSNKPKMKTSTLYKSSETKAILNYSTFNRRLLRTKKTLMRSWKKQKPKSLLKSNNLIMICYRKTMKEKKSSAQYKKQ